MMTSVAISRATRMVQQTGEDDLFECIPEWGALGGTQDLGLCTRPFPAGRKCTFDWSCASGYCRGTNSTSSAVARLRAAIGTSATKCPRRRLSARRHVHV